MPEIEKFSEIDYFKFRYGGRLSKFIEEGNGRRTINSRIREKGWRPIGKEEIEEIMERYKKFLYKWDYLFIGTKEDSIRVVESGEYKGNVYVPAVKSLENDLIFYENYLFRNGIVPGQQSNVAVLVVK